MVLNSLILSMERYADLRREFLSIARFHIKPEAVEELKIFYANAINSVRRSEYIENIEDLIKVLEKRNVIRYNNITPLKHIARTYLFHSSINAKIDNYEIWLKSEVSSCLSQLNLYKLPKGESYFKNSDINDFSSSTNSNNSCQQNNLNIQSCKESPLTCKSFLDIINNHNLHNTINSETSTSLETHTQNNNLSSTNSSIRNNNTNNNNITHISNNGPYNIISNTISNVPSVPSTLILKSTQIINFQNLQNKTLESPSVDENIVENYITVKTALLSVPQSLQPQTTCLPQIKTLPPNQSLIKSNVNENDDSEQAGQIKCIPRRNFNIVIIVLLVVIAFSILTVILCGVLLNSVQNKLGPSAPILQEVYPSYPPTNIPYTGYNPQWNSSNITGMPEQSHEFHSLIPSTSQSMEPVPNLQTLSQKDEQIQQMVFQKVSVRLGKYWRDVARFLHVRECEIDKIEVQYNQNLQEQAYAALKIFARETDLDHWQRELKSALEQARRRDLKEYVEELLDRRY